MKKLLGLVMVVPLFFCLFCFAESNYDFSGEWFWRGQDKLFSLNLWQRGDILRGEYCLRSLDGERIDCDLSSKSKDNIFGVINGNVAKVDFFSHRSIKEGASGKGRAVIVLKEQLIHWQVLEHPYSSSTPDSAILIKHKQ